VETKIKVLWIEDLFSVEWLYWWDYTSARRQRGRTGRPWPWPWPLSYWLSRRGCDPQAGWASEAWATAEAGEAAWSWQHELLDTIQEIYTDSQSLGLNRERPCRPTHLLSCGDVI
jgi:hypothetical protein